MVSQFDPELPNLLRGEFTEVVVNDPAIQGHVPNLVLDPTKPFEIKVGWKLIGTEVPVYLKALDASDWIVAAYAESMGPGPELKLTEGKEPKANFTGGPSAGFDFEWSHTLQVPAGLLQEEDPGGTVSGTYLLVATVFLNSNLGPAGYDIAGFNQGPMIKVENPN